MTANLLLRGRRIGFLTSWGALIAAGVPSSLATPAEDRKPPFEFVSPSSLDIAWKANERSSYGTATVANNTTAPLTLRVTLSPLELKDPSGKPLENASVLRLTANGQSLELDGSGTFVLPPAGLVALRVSAAEPSAGVKPETYPAGFLTLSESTTTRFVVRLPVTLSMADGSASSSVQPLKSLVESITIVVYRWPFTAVDRCPDCLLPVESGSSAGVLKDKAVVGALNDEKGGTLRIHARGVTGEPAPALRLEPDHAPHPGTYKGKMDVDPGNASAGTVNVTLIVKHEWPFPVTVLGLSVYAALRIKRYLTVWRGLWTLRAREAALGAVFETSQAAFGKAARGRPYAAMTIYDSLSVRRQALVAELDGLEASGDAVTAETSRYKAAETELKAIESTLGLWASFADRLEALDDALKDARDAAESVPPDLRGPTTTGLVPTVVVESAAMLESRPLEFGGLGALGDEVEAARSFVTAWSKQASTVAGLFKAWEELAGSADKMQPEDKKKLHSSLESLASIVSQLWALDLLNVEKSRVILATIDQVRSDLDVLAIKQRKAETDFEVRAARRAVRSAALETPLVAETLRTDADRRALYGKTLRRWDTRIGWLAFVIAVVAGMNQYYLGQAFGTFKDYLSLILVGLGTRAALDALNAVLDRFILPR